MSMQRMGKAYIKVDGALLESLPGAKIDIGGTMRASVVGSNKVLGYSESIKPSEVDCEISLAPETSLAQMGAWSDVTVMFECDTGQVYVVRNAWLADTVSLTEGEGGKVPLKFAGPPAEETK